MKLRAMLIGTGLLLSQGEKAKGGIKNLLNVSDDIHPFI